MLRTNLIFLVMAILAVAGGFWYNHQPREVLTYHWRQVYGPSQAHLVTPDSSSTKANDLQEGLYQFELTVTDSTGDQGKDCVLVRVNPPVVLPIILLYFRGSADKDFNLLEWQSESEMNAAWYGIEFSTDGINFKQIAVIDANRRGSVYNYRDFTNTPIAYYRLRMMDRDGQYKYSNVVKLKRKFENRFLLGGTVVNELRFDFISAIKTPAKFTIHDMSGRLMANYEINLAVGDNNMNFNITTYARGYYVIRIKAEDFEETKKFLKR